MALVYTNDRYWFYAPAPSPAGVGLFWQAADNSLAVYTQAYVAP